MNDAENTISNLTIRPATMDDSARLWRWANDASVREVSFSPEPIAWESHLEWFSRRMDSPNTQFYLLLENDEPVGQIRYDRGRDGKSAEISFSIKHAHRGKGFGTQILLLTREQALKDLDCERITALVIEGNEASRKAFVRAGFELDKMIEVRDHRAHRFIWQPTEK
jgi:UDP-2,4-diacetamido-2,4,6-trideoxy-beta-L-altropyranose hydrolase